MLRLTSYKFNKTLLPEMANSYIIQQFRETINRPTGNFFYDPWVVKDEFKGTLWEEALKCLPEPIGEARIISLEPGKCYQSHADIDDRYHLNIAGDNAMLVNLDNERMFPLEADGYWNLLNAGKRHSAINFGRETRIQLVVRKLLYKNTLLKPVKVTVTSTLPKDHSRYLFDNTISGYLNKVNKLALMSNFNPSEDKVEFCLEEIELVNFKKIVPKEFNITCE